jgi:histidinol-phosphate aminotransferase
VRTRSRRDAEPFDAARLANSATAALRAYDPGHDLPALRKRFGAAIAELGSNENPLGPSPRALEAMRAALADGWRYPDPRGAALKAALSAHLGVDTQRIALGNGSHELLMLLAQCFADSAHSVVFSQYGFAVFPIATAAAGAQPVRVPALPRAHASAPFGHDLDAIAAAVRADTRIVYLANPNNPTGTWFDDAALERFLARVPDDVLVVVDEAYHEYVDAAGPGSALRLAERHPNLVVTRTFSKAYALAGLRVGYLVAHASVVGVLERLRESFNVNSVALAGAEAALADRDHLDRVRAFNRAEREWMQDKLSAHRLDALPSQTNFLLVDLGRDAAELERHLFERGVIVRPMGGYGLGHTVRISVGSRLENLRLLDALP